jgi:hypothetical protein
MIRNPCLAAIAAAACLAATTATAQTTLIEAAPAFTADELAALPTAGWVRNASDYVPGPSTDVPPDAPPTVGFAMFPTVYPIPFHYPNPVTGD